MTEGRYKTLLWLANPKMRPLRVEREHRFGGMPQSYAWIRASDRPGGALGGPSDWDYSGTTWEPPDDPQMTPR